MNFNWKKIFSRVFWRKWWGVLTPLEKKIFRAGISVLIICLLFFVVKWYFNNSVLTPRFGGTLKEGIIGQPTSLNPILTQNEVDQDITSLVFNGLLKSDGKGGLQNDLATSVEKSDDGKEWTVRLRQDVFWQDGEPFTADDVVFTITAIQNPDSRSPWRLSWEGVGVSKFNEYTVIFELKSPFAFFEEKLKQKIIPEHIFKDIPLANLYLSDYNFQPIGTGPYIFEKLAKNKNGYISQYQFKSNAEYFLGQPYIDKYILKFYKSEPEAIVAFSRHEVDMLGGISAQNEEDIKRRYDEIGIYLPRYYAVFFNQSISKVLKDESVRYALNYATDRQEIIEKVYKNKAQSVEGPILVGMMGYDPDLNFNFSMENARDILEDGGWVDSNEDGVLEKKLAKSDTSATELAFSIVVPESSGLIETASILKNQWAKIGVKLTIKVVSASEFQQNYLETRVYDSIIYGNVLNQNPDPFPFWHSSQKFDPGSNLALYENSAVDRILEEFRQIFDYDKQVSDLKKFQSLIFADAPAVFLFNPQYLVVSVKNLGMGEIERVNLVSDKYFNVNNWYLKTQRTLNLGK